jgi:solute carrier family 25, member 39/40
VSYEQIRVNLKDFHMQRTNQHPDEYEMPLLIPLIAGCSARIFAVTIVNPLELIRTKMQSERMSYREVGSAFKKMIQQHGVRGLFKGLMPTILRDTPFSSIYWTCYESFKKFNKITHPNVTEAFIGGAISGTCAAFVTCPFDVIKTHQQIEFGEKFLYHTNGRPANSMRQTMLNIVKASGIRGFYAGLTPRLIKVAPACAIMISTYEYGKKFFHAYNVQKYYEKYPNLKNI